MIALCALTACGGAAAPGGSSRGAGPPSRPAQVAPVAVVASAFALAQLVAYIGGPDVAVVDLPGPQAQPQGLHLTAAQRQRLRSAALVVYVGDGYQPEVEAAARTARRAFAVLPAVSRQAHPYEFWLDPYLMAKAAPGIARALTLADPAGRRQFADGARDFEAVAQSLESDFVSTFSQCAQSYFVTSDDAFGRMAASFGLVDVPVDEVGPARARAIVAARQLPEVFGEIGSGSAGVDRVARAAGVEVASLDPLELAPAAGTAPLSYFSLMEQDLSTLSGGLTCNTAGSFS